MKKSRYLMIALGMGLALTLAGCSTEEKKAADVAPTAAPTATPTAVPVTVTPAPTATPAPRVIGVKNSQSKFVYLTNSLNVEIREIYLMSSGAGDWGKNLIPAESVVKAAEQVQMFYTPESGAAGTDMSTAGDTSEEDGTDGQASAEAVYDMKLVTGDGNSYEIYSVPLGDMEKAALSLDQDTSTAYLRYMSLSEKKEKDTKDNYQQDGSDSGDSSYDENSDDGSGDGSSDSGSYDDSSYDGSDDGSYDGSDDGSYDGSGDGSYDGGDDGSYDGGDDGSYDGGDDGSYDGDGSGDDGSYDGSGDDSYDNGYDDSGFADEDNNGDGYYDTQE